MPYLSKGRMSDVNNGPGGDSNSGPILAPRRLFESNANSGPILAPALFWTRIVALFWILPPSM